MPAHLKKSGFAPYSSMVGDIPPGRAYVAARIPATKDYANYITTPGIFCRLNGEREESLLATADILMDADFRISAGIMPVHSTWNLKLVVTTGTQRPRGKDD
jgi:hypothetical protein